jgi:hypothetical protein
MCALLPHQALTVASAELLCALGEPQQSAEQFHLAERVAEPVPYLVRLRQAVDEGFVETHGVNPPAGD